MLGTEHGLVSLDVDVDIGLDGLGDGVNAIGAAGAVFGRKDRGEAVLLGVSEDFVGIGGDEHLIEQRAGAGRMIDAGDHGLSGDLAQDFARQAGGTEARRDDGESSLADYGLAGGFQFNQLRCSLG